MRFAEGNLVGAENISGDNNKFQITLDLDLTSDK